VFEEKRIRVGVAVPERLPLVRADVDRVIQVMLNLLSNAAKFCDAERGRIEIAATEQDGALRVDVRDNGPGIASEHQAVIFDKFRQVGDTLTAKPHGSGLGLHISRQIVEHFGGRMWVESAPGQGACFSFTLPVDRRAMSARLAALPVAP
jgi:signal transduction histidine kinase